MKIDPRISISSQNVPLSENKVVTHHTCAGILSEEKPLSSPAPAQQAESNLSCSEILSTEAPFKSRHWRETRDQETLDFVDQQPPGYIYADRDLLCIEYLAKIPVSNCIKSNGKADRVMKFNLRSPLQPGTWWGKCPRRITIGLSEKEYAKHLIQTSLAKAALLGALVAFWFGIVANPMFCLLAFAALIVSGLLNAFTPIWYREVSREFTSVKGVSMEFLEELNQTKAHHNPFPGHQNEVTIPQ